MFLYVEIKGSFRSNLAEILLYRILLLIFFGRKPFAENILPKCFLTKNIGRKVTLPKKTLTELIYSQYYPTGEKIRYVKTNTRCRNRKKNRDSKQSCKNLIFLETLMILLIFLISQIVIHKLENFKISNIVVTVLAVFFENLTVTTSIGNQY